MAYDSKTYGRSPFGNSATTAKKSSRKTPRPRQTKVAEPEALSDQISDQAVEPATETEGAEADTPALPASYAPEAKSSDSVKSPFAIPKGRITGLNMLGEASGWLMAWGTVGFFRAYVPTAVLLVFDKLFHPWGMASITFISALLTAQLLRRLQHKLSHLRKVATAAIEYGELNHRADAQKHIYELLSTAEHKTDMASRWLTSWLTALGCLFIIGAFY